MLLNTFQKEFLAKDFAYFLAAPELKMAARCTGSTLQVTGRCQTIPNKISRQVFNKYSHMTFLLDRISCWNFSAALEQKMIRCSC